MGRVHGGPRPDAAGRDSLREPQLEARGGGEEEASPPKGVGPCPSPYGTFPSTVGIRLKPARVV